MREQVTTSQMGLSNYLSESKNEAMCLCVLIYFYFSVGV